MKKIYPIKFLDAYTRSDADIFFGREAEVDRLYEMVFQTDLLLIHGASGTGKTSLIQCGLASRFQSHDWLDLYIRRGDDLNESLEKSLLRTGGTLEANDDLGWLEEDLTEEEGSINVDTTLSPLSRRLKSIYLQHFRPIFLIFDQFEELYILGNKQEQDIFIQSIKEILRVEQPVKIILSIREEYLGYLYEFERQVPELLRKKLRVEPMNLEKVKTVVKQVGKVANGNISLTVGEEEGIAQGIFDKIRGQEKTLSIQLPYLQVFLDKLYMQISGDEQRQTDTTFSLAALQQMGDIGDVLRDFLDEQVLKIAKEYQQQPKTIWAILSPFVTLEGTKDPLRLQELNAKLKDDISPTLIAQCLEAFSKRRILRYNEQEEVYEIMHDSLAKQIHAKRSDDEIALLEVQRLVSSQTTLNADAREYFSEKQLEFIAPFREKLRLSTTEAQYLTDSQAAVAKDKARALRRRNITIALVALAFAVMVALTFWAVQQQRKAQATLKQLQLNQKVKVAEELKAYGDSYRDLGKEQAALETYQAALDSLGDYSDLDLYRELEELLEN